MVTKGHTHLHNPAAVRCRFVKGHERVNKINVHGYPLGPVRNC